MPASKCRTVYDQLEEHWSFPSRITSGSLKVYLTEADNEEQTITLAIAGIDVPLAHNSKVLFKAGSYIFPPPQDLNDIDRSEGDGLVQLEIPQASRSDRELLRSIITDWTKLEHHQGQDLRSQLVLIDESTGDVVGQLKADFTEDDSLKRTGETTAPPEEYVFDEDKEPVVVSFDDDVQTGGAQPYPKVHINPLSNVSSRFGKSPSKIVSSAEFLSRGILTAAEKLGGSMTNGAERFTSSSPATQSPLVFHSTAKKGVEGLHGLTETAAMLSGKTIGAIGNAVGNVGSAIGKKLGIQSTPGAAGGPPPTGIKGVISSSIQAIGTLADSIEAGGKHIYDSSTAATAHIAYHKLGPDAATAVTQISKSGRNVALVYVDARGFGRRAMIKNFGKGAIKAKLDDGSEVTLAPDVAIVGESTAVQPLQGGGKAMQIRPPGTPVQGQSGESTPLNVEKLSIATPDSPISAITSGKAKAD